MVNRRVFLKNCALAMAGFGSAPAWLARTMQAGQGKGKVLVAIFQRGAADGLNIVAPVGEKRYYELRPSIAVPGNQAVELDGRFALHPSMAPLKPLWDEGQLAVVHATGSPDPTRSHFDAQDFMESGTPGLKSTRDGWLNRAIPSTKGSPVRAVAVGQQLPRALRGRNAAVAVNGIQNFRVKDSESAEMFQNMYAGSVDTTLNGPGKDTFEAVRLLESIQKRGYTPSAQYPRGRFAESLKQIAQLIKADAGLEVAFADTGGWDHHVNEVGAQITLGPLANKLTEFGGAMAAFYRDLGDRMQDVTVVTMSEFGRTARENGNRGTDHGHANCMFVMGGGIPGGKVYGKWPGLEQEQLYEARDLAVTTDFRDVLSSVIRRQVGLRDIGAIFPGFQTGPDVFA
jgi:uncharacterized protein (DUF1501 family)